MMRFGMLVLAGSLLALLALPALAPSAMAQSIDKKAIGLADAKKMAAAAEAEAKKLGVAVVIAITDEGGNLIYLQKLDDAGLASVDIAQGKARTSARFKAPSKVMADAVAGPGGTSLLSIPGIMPLQGGLPVKVDNKVIGAIAASGASAAQDEQIAQAGLDALGKK